MIKVFPLDFLGQGALLQPKNEKLHDMAIEYCNRELAAEVDLSKFAKVFVAAEVDESGAPVKVTGITGYGMRPDISLFRATSDAATVKLHHRWHTFFADNGCLDEEVLIHLSGKDTPEQRCSKWDKELEAAKAIPADRYLVKVRAM